MMSAVDAKLRGDVEAVQTLSASQALLLDDLPRFQQEAAGTVSDQYPTNS